MLEKLFSFFGLTTVKRGSMIFSFAEQIVDEFEQEFKEDKNAKLAAFDTMINLLQKHREELTKSDAVKNP
jgi:hypothetical protein